MGLLIPDLTNARQTALVNGAEMKMAAVVCVQLVQKTRHAIHQPGNAIVRASGASRIAVFRSKLVEQADPAKG